MIKGVESVGLFVEDAKKVAEFYRDKVGLKVTFEAEMGDENEEMYEFKFEGGGVFYVVDHSKVKGKNKNPERIMFNLETDDIKKEFEKLKKNGVKVVQEVYHVENYGYLATFEDVEGNYFQVVQVKG